MPKSKVAGALLIVVALAACSGSDKKPGPGISGKAASPASGSSSSSSAEASTGVALDVLAAQPTPDRYAFDTSGTESLPSGPVTISLNNATTVPQSMVLIRLRDTDFNSFKATLLAQGLTAATALGDVAYSSPTVVPGKSTTDTAVLTAGVYALVAPLPAPDGRSLAEHGMLTRVEVTPGALSTGSASSETSGSSTGSSASGSSSSSSSTGSSSPSSSSSSASSS